MESNYNICGERRHRRWRQSLGRWRLSVTTLPCRRCLLSTCCPVGLAMCFTRALARRVVAIDSVVAIAIESNHNICGEQRHRRWRQSLGGWRSSVTTLPCRRCLLSTCCPVGLAMCFTRARARRVVAISSVVAIALESNYNICGERRHRRWRQSLGRWRSSVTTLPCRRCLLSTCRPVGLAMCFTRALARREWQ